jgi:predicted ATP-binding protein involved in virulence
MSNFITKIQVNKIFHLKDFTIPLSETEKKHLLITGKNGSGKTILLNAIIEHLNTICRDANCSFLDARKNMSLYEGSLQESIKNSNQAAIASNSNTIRIYQTQIEKYFGQVELSFKDIYSLVKDVNDRSFIIAYYGDERKSDFVESINPVKPDLNISQDLTQNKVNQFINFMVDYKVQEALARNEGKISDADEIKAWFENFEKNILGEIFGDKNLQLEFNYKDYTFHIHTGGKSFKFIELSAGYSAVLDIVTDLILKMQSQDRIIRAYEKEGIVLIDEIETHLHLGMQKIILPLLTTMFPNIQFIVTTHSPFILNSLRDAIAYDLESREQISDLTDYSYEALAEGYLLRNRH